MNNETTTFQDSDGNQEEVTVNFCFHSAYNTLDAEAPKDVRDAMYGLRSKDWIPSMASEIMNFLKRKCWKKVPQDQFQDNRK
jgi:hypothetical protein